MFGDVSLASSCDCDGWDGGAGAPLPPLACSSARREPGACLVVQTCGVPSGAFESSGMSGDGDDGSALSTAAVLAIERSATRVSLLVLRARRVGRRPYFLTSSSTCPPAFSMRSIIARRSSICWRMYSTVRLRTSPSERPWPSRPGTSSVRRSNPSRIACLRFCSAGDASACKRRCARRLLASTGGRRYLMRCDSVSSPPPSGAASRPPRLGRLRRATSTCCSETTLRALRFCPLGMLCLPWVVWMASKKVVVRGGKECVVNGGRNAITCSLLALYSKGVQG